MKFTHLNCKYYPCHKKVESCVLCYCPAYPCLDKRTGGRMYKDTVWDCSDCTFVHKDIIVGKIGNYIVHLIEEEYGKTERS